MEYYLCVFTGSVSEVCFTLGYVMRAKEVTEASLFIYTDLRLAIHAYQLGLHLRGIMSRVKYM